MNKHEQTKPNQQTKQTNKQEHKQKKTKIAIKSFSFKDTISNICRITIH